MARPVSVQDTVILEAARKVFLKHGFKATTAQVAREAGVSEGSLFKHFKTKTALFLTAMQVEGLQMPWHDELLDAVGSGDIRARLESAGRQLLQRLQVIVPRMMMMQSSGLLSQADCHRFVKAPPPVYHVRVLARYLRAEIKLGRLALRDPESQAHAFFGALSHYVFSETLFGYRPAAPTAYVRAVVDTLVRAGTPATGGAGRRDAASAKTAKDA